ncbi:hypothetical protein PAHAL_7G092800 [Panicum hallii]|uniref:Secreted protein n=1 Tax=Panicum hallii TaxID=206008 RepID=A0A2S3I5K4_9POAL|nr:hypothetical protein PAHAL_7G092800 [Panicum hallii]
MMPSLIVLSQVTLICVEAEKLGRVCVVMDFHLFDHVRVHRMGCVAVVNLGHPVYRCWKYEVNVSVQRGAFFYLSA